MTLAVSSVRLETSEGTVVPQEVTAETVRTKATVEVQNRLIMNGLDPTNDLDERHVLNKVDIKKK